jgi:signal transduction histidine kinase
LVPHHRWSIRWWLASLVGGVALPLTLLLTLSFLAQEREVPLETQESAVRIARALATRLRLLHVDSRALLDRLSARAEMVDFDGRRCDSLIAAIGFFPEYLNLVLLDRSGQVVCFAGPQFADAKVSPAALQWIGQELRGGRLRPGMPLIRSVQGHWVSVAAQPVPGRFGRTLVVAALPEVVGGEDLPPSSVITVFDDRGTIVARTRDPQKWVGRNTRGSTLAEIVLRRKEGSTEARGVDGIARQYGFTTLPELGWSIAVGVPTEAVMAPARAAFLRGIGGAALIVMLLIVAAVVMSRAISRPLDALARAAASVADGAYGKVEAEGPREIRVLAEAFNEMVENRSRAETRLREGEQKLKALSERLLVAQEEERSRIARELHDDLGQSLTALKMDIGGLLQSMPSGGQSMLSGGLSPIAERIIRTIDSTVTAVQRISSELRPSMLDDLGLAAAIESEALMFEERTGIECELSMPSGTPVESVTATTIYRIVQEALTNVARHSNASRVELRLRLRDTEVLVEVRDDGRGITSQEVGSARSLGLIGIRERAEMVGGTARFEGIPGRGTIVSVSIPTAGAPAH